MDIFRSDKAPYVLGLLITIIGWHITQLANEVTKTQAVSYSISRNPETGEIYALIRNVSRTKSLVNATFSLACPAGVDCLIPIRPVARGGTPVYGRIEPIAPNALSSQTPPVMSRQSVAFTNTIAAGGSYRIVARVAHPDQDVHFFFIPDGEAERPLDIYIYDRNTVGGIFVEKYLWFLGASLVICILALLYSLVRGRAFASEGEKKEEAKNGA